MGGTVTLNTSNDHSVVVAEVIQVNDGTISGYGNLVTTTLNWLSGTQNGNGTTTVNGTTNFGDGSNYYSYQSLGSGSNNGRTLTLNGDSILQSSYVTLNGGSTINNNGTFTSKGDVRNNTVYSNIITSFDYGSTSTFNNAGAFVQDASGKQTTVGVVTFNNTGVVYVKSGTLQLDNLSNYNRTSQTLSGGSYHIDDGNTLAINLGNSTNSIRTNSAVILLNGPNAHLLNTSVGGNALSGLATNTSEGALLLLNGAALGIGNFSNAGHIEIGAGSSLVSSTDYVQNAGVTFVEGTLSANLVDIQGGILAGNGTITGNVSNAGLIIPGGFLVTLNVQGDFTQRADGILAIDIAGTDQGVSYDWLNISGTASLAGTLDVFFTAGYLPAAGNAYTILSYGDWDQTTFDAIQVTGLDLAQYTYSTHYSDTGLTLSIAAVPEPSTYALLLAGLGMVGFVARRRKVSVTA